MIFMDLCIFTQVPLIFMITETIVTSCLRIFGYVKDSEESYKEIINILKSTKLGFINIFFKLKRRKYREY